MTLLVRDGGNVQREINAIQVRDGTNTTRDINAVYVRDSNNVSRLVFSTASTLTVSIAPQPVAGYEFATGVVTTDAAVATPSGGTAPYTYLWTLISYTNPTMPAINAATSASSDFTQTGVVTYDEAVFRCTVTDALAFTAYDEVTAFFQNIL